MLSYNEMGRFHKHDFCCNDKEKYYCKRKKWPFFVEITLGHHFANIFKSLWAKKTAVFAICTLFNSPLLFQVMELSLM